MGTAALLALLGLGTVAAWRFVWPAEQLAAAEEALRQHDFPDARFRLDWYLVRWPRDQKALLLAARAAWQSGAYADAERFLSVYEDVWGPADASRLEWALLGAHQGDFADEENRLRSFVEHSHPDAPAILEALAKGYQLAWRWSEAIQALNALIDYTPGYAAFLVQRGTTVRRWRGPDGVEPAEKDFRRALALAPGSAAAHAALAAALSEQGHIQEGMDHYQLALHSQPDDPEALLGLARGFTDAAKLAEAEQRLEELLAAHPDHPEGLVERGRLALRRGRAAEAEGFLARAVRGVPSHRDGTRLYLATLKELGRSEAAAQGEAHLAELRAEDAVGGRLKLRLQNAPEDVGSHWELYQWSLRNGQHPAAFACLLEVLRRAPRHGLAHAALAEHFDQAGQPRRASQHRAMARGPK